MLTKQQIIDIAENAESDTDVNLDRLRKFIAEPVHGRTESETFSRVRQLLQTLHNDIANALGELNA